MTTPLYMHDCDQCRFLGHYEGADLYFHPDDEQQLCAIIARKSSRLGDHISGFGFARVNHHLDEAEKRATAKGLI